MKKTPAPSAYAVIWEDIMASAKTLQDHEKVLRPALASRTDEAEQIRRLVSDLYDAIEGLHHDVTSGGKS